MKAFLGGSFGSLISFGSLPLGDVRVVGNLSLGTVEGDVGGTCWGEALGEPPPRLPSLRAGTGEVRGEEVSGLGTFSFGIRVGFAGEGSGDVGSISSLRGGGREAGFVKRGVSSS
jgi:hypothetical protein